MWLVLWSLMKLQWWIQGEHEKVCLHLGSISFISMQFSAKTLLNNRIAFPSSEVSASASRDIWAIVDISAHANNVNGDWELTKHTNLLFGQEGSTSGHNTFPFNLILLLSLRMQKFQK